MDVFINLFHGLLTALQPFNLGIMLIGLAVGVIAGALPGISFVNAMAMALPFTYLMTPLSAMVFLGGIYAGGVFGGSISAILINIPGTPASLPSCWDGYPMTKRGEAARALTLAIAASATGGLASALLLTFGAPPFAKLALAFDQPEFFAATFLGLVSIIAIAKSAPWISMVSLFCGIVDRQRGRRPAVRPAATDLRPAGAAERHQLRGRDDRPVRARARCSRCSGSRQPRRRARPASVRLKLPSLQANCGRSRAAARGTGIGCMIGMIPGAGATVGAVIAYGVEKQVSPRGAEFGTGVEAGLVAPEAAKNATTGAAMIPLLTLGIPGSAATAIMLAALVLHGVTPGPLLFATQTDMVYTIFASLLLANLLHDRRRRRSSRAASRR